MPYPGPDDHADDDLTGFSVPLPPDDRLWRHPSEMELGPRSPWPPKRGVGWPAVLVAGVLSSALTVGALFVGGVFDDEAEPRAATTTVVPVRAPASRVSGLDVVGIAAEVSPAIARVDIEGDESVSGSAVIFRSDGYLLTNAHVVAGATDITVVLADGSEWEGELVGSDEETDIAVVKIDGDEPFTTAPLGSAAQLQVGEPAIAIGSPLGLIGGSSVTTGVVSALGREVRSDEGPTLYDMIQTDAAIAPGSSGGALLDGRGAVIGITTAIAVSEVGAEGLGFATPVDIARSLSEQIILTGEAVHVWLGIKGGDLDAVSADEAGVNGGALVEQVFPDSPAAAAGIGRRDVILSVDGEAVVSMSGLVIALRDRRPGEQVTLEVLRDGQRTSVPVVLVEKPENP